MAFSANAFKFADTVAVGGWGRAPPGGAGRPAGGEVTVGGPELGSDGGGPDGRLGGGPLGNEGGPLGGRLGGGPLGKLGNTDGGGLLGGGPTGTVMLPGGGAIGIWGNAVVGGGPVLGGAVGGNEGGGPFGGIFVTAGTMLAAAPADGGVTDGGANVGTVPSGAGAATTATCAN